MGVSKNSGTPKSSILIGFSIIFTIHFGGFPPIFGNTHIHIYIYISSGSCGFLTFIFHDLLSVAPDVTWSFLRPPVDPVDRKVVNTAQFSPDGCETPEIFSLRLLSWLLPLLLLLLLLLLPQHGKLVFKLNKKQGPSKAPKKIIEFARSTWVTLEIHIMEFLSKYTPECIEKNMEPNFSKVADLSPKNIFGSSGI